MSGTRWLPLICCGLLLLLGWHRAAGITVSRQDNLLLIDKQPTPLIFARNFQDPREIKLYHSAGFNTVLVQIDNPAKYVLEHADALIAAAEEEGLYVLVELRNGPWSSGTYADPNSEEYQVNCDYFLDTVVKRFAQCDNLVGWVVSTVDEQYFLHYLGSFGSYLLAKYGSEQAITQAWTIHNRDGMEEAPGKFTLRTLDSLASRGQLEIFIHGFATKKKVAEKVREDFAGYQEMQTARDTAFQQHLQGQYRTLESFIDYWNCTGRWAIKGWKDITIDAVDLRERRDPGSSPRSLLDLANYRIGLTTSLLDWWAQALAKYDAKHLLFAGSQYAYRTLPLIPDAYAGVLTECYPGYTEGDIYSQNPHAIDMARRSNRKIVLAGMLASGTMPEQLFNTLYLAGVHGASGLCLTDWNALYPNKGDAKPLMGLRDTLLAIQRLRLLNRTPAPGIAIVYSPYLPGPRLKTRGLYGYMPVDYLHPNTSLPFFSFREGTACGQVDFLAPSDLARVPLRYSAIILPSVFDLPVDAQDALLQYVERDGGTVVADIGLGTLQAKGDLYSLPERMIRLFNVRSTPGVRRALLNLEVNRASSRFPGLLPGYRTQGEVKGYQITHITDMIPLAGTDLLFTTVADRGYSRPKPVAPKRLEPKPTRGVFVHRKQSSNGHAIFVPFALYQHWMPGGDVLFNRFHRDLVGNQADVVLMRPSEFFPSMAQVARYADGSVAVWTAKTNPEIVVRNPWPSTEGPQQIYWTSNRKDEHNNPEGYCVLTPELTYLRYQRAGLHMAQALPMRLQRYLPEQGTYQFSFRQFDQNGIALTIQSDGQDVAQPARLLVQSSESYPIEPNSLHWATRTGSANVRIPLRADARGELILPLTGDSCTITIVPDDGTEVTVPIKPLE